MQEQEIKIIKDTSFQMQSDQIDELMTAKSKADATLNNIKKDGKVEYSKTKYSYAVLEDVCNEVRKKYSKFELSFTQIPLHEEGTNVLVTTLGHSSGQWIRCKMKIEQQNAGPQAYGSALTYARRYSLVAMSCLAATDEDDDAQEAQGIWNIVDKHGNIVIECANEQQFLKNMDDQFASLENEGNPKRQLDKLLVLMNANKKKIDECAMGESLRNKAQDIRVKLREEINNAKS
tara:strand:+ start:528 stop:1226 length:699 start_codon:yes stop_codon:yes gene_type:complete